MPDRAPISSQSRRPEIFFKTHHLNEEQRRLLGIIEKIADQVDRGESPVSAEEFNKRMTPASQWLKNEEEIRMARALEEGYTEFVRGLSFEDYRKTRSRLRDCLKIRLDGLKISPTVRPPRTPIPAPVPAAG